MLAEPIPSLEQPAGKAHYLNQLFLYKEKFQRSQAHKRLIAVNRKISKEGMKYLSMLF